MNNNELFLDKYRELENLIKHRKGQEYRGNSPVYSYVQELYRSPHLKDQLRGEKLDSIRELRNQMAHKNVDGILNISIEAIEFLDKEIQNIQNPLSAFDICVKLNDIHYATLKSNLNKVMDTMLSYGYSHIPVLDDNKMLIGVFSENTIFSIYKEEKNILNKENLSLNDIYDYLKINNHQTECFTFVNEKYFVNDIIKRFQKRKENNKRLTVIFVTKDGTQDSTLMGMITPYDALIK